MNASNRGDIPSAPLHHVVAILLVGRGYVLQHRDDVPGIAAPGTWGLFGGVIEPGETPLHTVRREIHEELGLDVTAWQQLWTVSYLDPRTDRIVGRVVFEADVTNIWAVHVLGEGQATDVFQPDGLPSPMTILTKALIERHADQRL